jgi:Caspase recruitment domain
MNNETPNTKDKRKKKKRKKNKKKTLSLKHSALQNIILTEYGLLDELFSTGIFSEHEAEQIKCDSTPTGKVSKMLNHIAQMSNEQQQQFLAALDKTDQSHITQFIRHDGKKPDIGTDNWPIYPDNQWSKIKDNWRQLIELIDSRNGLLDELLSVGCINNRQKQAVDIQKVDDHRNDHLLNIFALQKCKRLQ